MTTHDAAGTFVFLVFIALMLATCCGLQLMGWWYVVQTNDILGYLLILPVGAITLPVSRGLLWLMDQ